MKLTNSTLQGIPFSIRQKENSFWSLNSCYNCLTYDVCYCSLQLQNLGDWHGQYNRVKLISFSTLSGQLYFVIFYINLFYLLRCVELCSCKLTNLMGTNKFTIGHFRVLPCPCLFCGLVTLTSIHLDLIISGLSSSV